MTDGPEIPPPAFYAAPSGRGRRAWTDWWVVLHPPYTLWHLSYVAIGAGVSPRFDGARLTATLVAFFLAVGVGAHALDELQGRPLGTEIPGRILAAAATVGIGAAVAMGIYGMRSVGAGLGLFIAAGVILNCGYNLELFGGRLHNDATFAAAWGSFPVLTGYYAQAENLRAPAIAAAAAAFWLSVAQRSLSTPARALRRRVKSVEGTIDLGGGRREPMSRSGLLAPLEKALKAMAFAMVALAVALIIQRSTSA